MIFHPNTNELIGLMDGELPEDKAQKMRSHLDGCETCRKKYELLLKINAVNTPQKELPENFSEQIVSNLGEIKKVSEKDYAEVKSLTGLVKVYNRSDEEGTEAFPGMSIKVGDRLKVFENSVALVELNDGSSLYLNKETDIEFTKEKYPLSLNIGEFFAMMKPQKEIFHIKTPSALLGVIGTDFDTIVTDDYRTILKVLKGKVSYQNESGKAIVSKKQKVEASKANSPKPVKTGKSKDEYKWTSQLSPREPKGERKMKKFIISIIALLAIIGLGYILYQGYTTLTYDSGYEVSSENLLEIKPRWKVGDRYTRKTVTQSVSEVKIPMNPHPLHTNMVQEQNMNVACLSVLPEGGYEIEFEYGDTKVAMDAGPEHIEYDSTSKKSVDPNDELSSVMNALIGGKFTVLINSEGEALSVEGYDDYAEKIQSKLTSVSPSVAPFLEGSISEEAIKSMVSQFSSVSSPGKPIEVGDSWTVKHNLTVPVAGELKMKVKSYFKGWENRMGRRCAYIEMKGSMKTKEGEIITVNDNKTKVEMEVSIEKGDFTGKSWYDPSIGMEIESQMEQDMILEVGVVTGNNKKMTMDCTAKNITSSKLIFDE